MLPLAAAVALGFSLVAGPGEDVFSTPHLAAAGQHFVDSDLDGLADLQERVLGSSATTPDSDGDGYSDAEEFARNSRSDSEKFTPLPAATDINMSARGDGGQLRVVVGIYLADGITTGRGIEVGLSLGHRILGMNPNDFLPLSTVTQLPGKAPGSLVVLYDIPIDERMVGVMGDLSVFTTLVSGAQNTVIGASAVDLLSRDSVIVLAQDPGDVRPQAALPGGQTGYGSIYNPIPPGGGGDIPVTWVPGEICYQASVVVGVSNGVVTREVVAAGCVEGWDASCRADCASSVGEVFDTFDPLGLVGQ